MYQDIFSCIQAALWTVQSVCLSISLSVRHTFSQCFCHHIMKFSCLDWSDVHTKRQGQRSKVKVAEVKKLILSQFWYFQTVIPVGIRKWQKNYAQSFKWHRKSVLLFFKVIHQRSRSNRPKNHHLNLISSLPYNKSISNSDMAMKWCTKPGGA